MSRQRLLAFLATALLTLVAAAPGSATDRTARPAAWSPSCEPPAVSLETLRSKETISRHMRRLLGSVRHCYQRARQRQPELAGRIVVQMAVLPSGRTDEVEVVQSTVGDEAVGACVAKSLRGWRFPEAPGAETVRFRYPFIFEPPKASGEESRFLYGGVGATATGAPRGAADARRHLARDLAATKEIASLKARIASLEGTPDEKRELREQLAARYVEQADGLHERARALPEGDDGREALVERRRKLLRQALEQYDRIVEGWPEAEDADRALFVTGMLLWELEQGERAATRFEQVIERFPRSEHVTAARFLVAEQRFAEGRFEEAAALYRQVGGDEASPFANAASYKLAWARFNLGAYEEALERFAAVAKLSKAEEAEAEREREELRRSAIRDLVAVFAEVRAPEDALPFFRELRPEQARALAERVARTWFEQGRFEAARELHETLRGAAPSALEAVTAQRGVVASTERLLEREKVPAQVKRLVSLLGEAARAAKEAERFAEERSAVEELVRELIAVQQAEAATEDARGRVAKLCASYFEAFSGAAGANEVLPHCCESLPQ